jgi:hypothetical protein
VWLNRQCVVHDFCHLINCSSRPFEFGAIHAQFYCQAGKLESRLLLLAQSPTGYPLLYCSLLQGLKIVRKRACLELHREDKNENAFRLWAKLCFPDYERELPIY